MKWLKNFFFIIEYYLIRIHWLSLDVVAGAMLTHVVASRLPYGQGKVSWASTVLVGISVFFIYVADRLIDNHKGTTPTTARHKFHAQHEAILLKVMMGLGVIGLICLFWLPFKVIMLGVGLMVVVSVYLKVIQKISSTDTFQLFKEPVVAIVYTIGVWGSAILGQEHTSWEETSFMVLLGIIAFQNLLLFSWFESFDIEEGYSLAIAWGTDTVSQIINILTILVVIGALAILFLTTHRYSIRTSVAVISMSLSLYFLKKHHSQFLGHERYRWAGDGIFFYMLWLL